MFHRHQRVISFLGQSQHDGLLEHRLYPTAIVVFYESEMKPVKIGRNSGIRDSGFGIRGSRKLGSFSESRLPNPGSRSGSVLGLRGVDLINPVENPALQVPDAREPD